MSTNNQAEQYLRQLREEFRARCGVYPSVMHVSTPMFQAVCPMKLPAQAIETTLILEAKQLPPGAVVIPKPPEAKKAA